MIRIQLLIFTLFTSLSFCSWAIGVNNVSNLSINHSPQIAAIKPSLIRQLSHQTLHLTSTTFTFFAALGALSVVELITQYENNPVVINQFIASQSDPVGQLALAAFVLSQGWTHSTLERLTQHSKLHSFIPYLGMTVGLVASQIVVETSSFLPELKMCLQQRSHCDALLIKWQAYPLKEEKIHQLFPGLVSMLSSSILAGIVDAGLQRTLLNLGFEVVISSTPAGVLVKIARGIYHTSRFAGFFYLDYILVDPIELWWQTHFGIGSQVNEEKQLLSQLLISQPSLTSCSLLVQTQDDKSCNSDLTALLNSYLTKNSRWIDFKARKIYQKQMAWTQYFSKLVDDYYEAQAFYGFLTDYFKQIQNNLTKRPSILDQEITLIGVYQNSGQVPSWNDYLYRPIDTQKAQIEFINHTNMIFSNKAKLIHWHPYEKKIINRILNLLSKSDISSIAEGIHLIRNYLKMDLYRTTYHQSQLLYSFLKNLNNELGPQALPIIGKGVGFLWVGMLMQQNYSNLQPIPISQTREKIFWYVNNLFNGPTTAQDCFNFNRSGYPAQFISPQIYSKPFYLKSRLFAEWEPLIGQHQLVNQILSNTHDTTIINYMAQIVLPENLLSDWELKLEESFQASLNQLKLKYSDVLIPLQDLLLKNTPHSLLNDHKNFLIELVALSNLAHHKQHLITNDNWVSILINSEYTTKELNLKLDQLYQKTTHQLSQPKAGDIKNLKLAWSQWTEMYLQKMVDKPLPHPLKQQIITLTQKHIDLLIVWISAFQLFDKDYVIKADSLIKPSCIPIENSLRHLTTKSCF